MKLTRRTVLAAGAATAAATSTLTGPLMRPGMAFEEIDGRKVLVYAGRQPVPILDPHQRYDWSTRMMQQAIYDGLVKYVGNPPRIEPWLATSWESNDDASVWTFDLVDNAKFHNGDPLDAEAVRYSFERCLTLGKGPSWMLSDFLTVDGIEVLSPTQIRFNLERPYAPFLSFLPWWYIVNPAEVEANAGDDMGQTWLTENSAGSGPYKIARWETGVLYQIEPVADYWKGWPMPEDKRLGGIIYRLVREAATQRAALQTGEADIVEGLSPDDFEVVGNLPGIRVENHPGMTTFGIKFNNAQGPMADVNMRRAVAHAFDYDSFLQIYNNNAVLQTSPFPDATRGKIAVDGFPRQDLDAARSFLAQTDYPDGGIELEFVYVQGLEEQRQMGLVLIDNLRELNISVNMVPLTWPNMTARGAEPDTMPDMMSIFVTPVSTDPDAVAYQYHPNSRGQYFGVHFYDNPDVTAMIEEARQLSDWDTRAPLYEEIQRRLTADQPEIFGMLANRRWAMHDYVKGFQFCPVRFTQEIDLYPVYIDA